MDSQIVLAKDWIIYSGIQDKEGGFNSWYDYKNKNYGYLYSEITGYAITTLLFLSNLFKEEIYIKRAMLAADWIIKCALHPCGGVRTRLYSNDKDADKAYSFSGENIFSFDTAMALYGMVNLYKLTRESRFLQASLKMADFIINKMYNKDGSLSPIYNAKSSQVVNDYDKWSNQRGSFLAKVSLGLVDLYEVTLDIEYRDKLIALCDYALTLQEPSGRFITNKLDFTTHLHPHCYTAEGLLYVGAAFKIKKFIEAAKKATDWALQHVNAEGINELYLPSSDTFNDFQRSDILAQVLRLGVILSSQHKKIDELSKVLLSYQYIGQDLSQKGAFLYNKKAYDLNSWCTMFSLQTLALYENKNLIPENKRIGLFI